MKLNSDLGEGFGQWRKGCDEDIMPYLDLANIACGFHASDPLTMVNTVKLAVKNGVIIGAHPSYPDLVGFGRRSMTVEKNELAALIVYQIGALQAICASENTSIAFVKPHGALYNDMMKNHDIFDTVCQAVASVNKNLSLTIQAVPDYLAFQTIADKYQLTLWFEAFADRHYQDDGRLVSRQSSQATIESAEEIIARCQYLQETGCIKSLSGKALTMKVDTLCVHGDNPTAVNVVKKLRHVLDER